MSGEEWFFLVAGIVLAGIVVYTVLVFLAEIVAKIGRRWGNDL